MNQTQGLRIEEQNESSRKRNIVSSGSPSRQLTVPYEIGEKAYRINIPMDQSDIRRDSRPRIGREGVGPRRGTVGEAEEEGREGIIFVPVNIAVVACMRIAG